MPIMRKLESSKYEPDYSGDRQTGRTTRGVMEAFKKDAYFIVHTNAMRDHVLYEVVEPAMRPWAKRKVLLVTGHGELNEHVRGTRNMKLVFDHAVWEHGTIKQQEECRHAQYIVDSYMTP